jgi:FixJ family two-component response regulator
VVDDDHDLQESLLVLLRALGRSCRGFESAEEFTDFYQDQPGCLVLDIQMSGRNGIELYEQLLLRGKRIPVIFMTAHATINTAVAALKTGAIDFLEKPFERKVLTDCIDRALLVDANWRAGETRYRQLDAAIRTLNTNERETLDLVIQGATNKAIAAKLFITERAVELRRQRLMKRLKVRSIPELLELTVTHRVLAEVRELNHRQPFPGL